MTYSGPGYWETSGTISAVDEAVELVCPGAGSVCVEVTGTFEGTLAGLGRAHSEAGLNGGRLLFKSGVGSLGTNVVSASGTYEVEWRQVAGGWSIAIKATAWTSGTATVRMSASKAVTNQFSNGATHTAEEQAIRAGRAYARGTGVQAVSNGNFLNVSFSNPVDSGVNMFIKRRIFASNRSGGDAPLEFGQILNPATPTLTTGGNGANLKGGGPASVGQFLYDVSGTRLDSSPSTPTPIGGIISIGQPYIIETERLLVPGEAVGFYVGGSGGGLSNAARVSISFVWFEEAIA